MKLFFSDFNTGQVSHLNHSTIKTNISSHKFRFSPFFIPGKSFESGSPRKFIPVKFFIRHHPRKFIPAKCKYFVVFLNRESFFLRKFLPLKYQLLYKSESLNEPGTLKFFREKYNHKNSTPSKVLNSYDGSEELFLSVGRAYIVTDLLHFFGMESITDYPTKNGFEANISHKAKETRLLFLKEKKW